MGTWWTGREIRETILLDAGNFPAGIEPRSAVISYPEWTWVDQPGKIKVDITPDQVRSAQIPGELGWFMEVRVDAPGVVVRPPGSLTQPLVPGKPVHFEWEATPSQGEEWKGVIWVYYQVVNKQSGQTQEIPVLAKQITIHTWSLFDLPLSTTRWLAISLLGIGIGCQILAMIRYPKATHRMMRQFSFPKKH
ncbi:MAG TPA: hypothetical protein VIO61_09760 [Anaerolineaceae bacterium]